MHALNESRSTLLVSTFALLASLSMTTSAKAQTNEAPGLNPPSTMEPATTDVPAAPSTTEEPPPPAPPPPPTEGTAPTGEPDAGLLEEAPDDLRPLDVDDTNSTAPTDPATGTDAGKGPTADEDASLKAAYETCLGDDAEGQDPQACLRQLIADHPTTETAKRAQAVLDAVRVMRRSGARLLIGSSGDDVNGQAKDVNGNGAPVEFDAIVSRVPATTIGTAYGLAFGTGLATIGALTFPQINSGLFIFSGGVVAVGAAVGAGTLGFYLSSPKQYGGEGSWLGSGALLAGSAAGLAAGLGLIDVTELVAPGVFSPNQAGPAVTIALGLTGGALGAAGGVFASDMFDLDHDQVAVANGMMLLGGVVGSSLAFAVGGTMGNFYFGRAGPLAAAAGTYLVSAAGITALGAVAADHLNFNAGEVLVASLAMLATSGVMLTTSGIATGILNVGISQPAIVGGSTAIAGTVGFVSTAAILYFLRDDARPLLRKMEAAGVTAMVMPPMVGVDRSGETAIYSPSLGGTF